MEGKGRAPRTIERPRRSAFTLSEWCPGRVPVYREAQRFASIGLPQVAGKKRNWENKLSVFALSESSQLLRSAPNFPNEEIRCLLQWEPEATSQLGHPGVSLKSLPWNTRAASDLLANIARLSAGGCRPEPPGHRKFTPLATASPTVRSTGAKRSSPPLLRQVAFAGFQRSAVPHFGKWPPGAACQSQRIVIRRSVTSVEHTNKAYQPTMEVTCRI